WRRRHANADRSIRPDRGDQRVAVSDVQSVYDDARTGRELGLRPEFRESAESARVYIAASIPPIVRRTVLTSRVGQVGSVTRLTRPFRRGPPAHLSLPPTARVRPVAG